MITKKHTIFVFAFFQLIFYACEERDWKNPYDADSNLDPISWAPKNLQIEQISITKVKLIWDQEEKNISGFKIDKKVGNSSWQIEYATLESNVREWTDTTIVLDTTTNYYYRLYAYAGEKNSSKIENSFNPSFPGPSNLQIQQLSVSELKLTWKDNSDGEDGFKIDLKIGSGDWVVGYGSTDADVTEWIDADPVFGEVNYYRVYAYAGENASSSVNGNINHILLAPTNLIATVVDEVKIRLDWNDNSNIEEGYKIERKILGEDYELLAAVNQNVTSFTDVDVENLVTYYFRSYGYTQNHQSDYSNEANATCLQGYQGMIVVPIEYLTIQAGINAASDGDTVLVFPGTYVENINFNGKNIVVGSLFITLGDTSFISQTVIDGNWNGSVMRFENDEDSTTVLSGFTIKNGSNDYGGGIYCNQSNPNLENIVVSGNRAFSVGGGIYCSNSSPSLVNVKLSGNTATDYGGGIACSYHSCPSLLHVTVSDNTAYEDGGGIYCNQSSPNLNNVIVCGNLALGLGGGIYCSYGSFPQLVNVTISENSSHYGYGGGIYCDSSYPYIVNCILWNDSPQEIFAWESFQIYYSDIQGGWEGINLNSNPLFIGNGDFHLQPGSPCINAGNPDPKYNDPDGSRNDMGAYGGPEGNW